jgi:hypothetical protein
MLPLLPTEEGGVPMIEGSLQNAIERATLASEQARKSGRNQIVISSE